MPVSPNAASPPLPSIRPTWRLADAMQARAPFLDPWSVQVACATHTPHGPVDAWLGSLAQHASNSLAHPLSATTAHYSPRAVDADIAPKSAWKPLTTPSSVPHVTVPSCVSKLHVESMRSKLYCAQEQPPAQNLSPFWGGAIGPRVSSSSRNPGGP
jgi:hypothetical protein